MVRLTAPPVEGAANEALVRFLGRGLGVAPSAVRIAAGTSGRSKRVAVSGIDAVHRPGPAGRAHARSVKDGAGDR